uniref:Uncharacterized protein n=1 Tax=Acrobeloides nanus TaxID=290746 RepID=A0A914CLB3_9BILA
MAYAGVAPIVVGCGEHNFSDTMDQYENCLLLKEIQRNESCIPKLETQFKSVNYEIIFEDDWDFCGVFWIWVKNL